jgi:hypothetical protein
MVQRPSGARRGWGSCCSVPRKSATRGSRSEQGFRPTWARYSWACYLGEVVFAGFIVPENFLVVLE